MTATNLHICFYFALIFVSHASTSMPLPEIWDQKFSEVDLCFYSSKVIWDADSTTRVSSWQGNYHLESGFNSEVEKNPGSEPLTAAPPKLGGPMWSYRWNRPRTGPGTNDADKFLFGFYDRVASMTKSDAMTIHFFDHSITIKAWDWYTSLLRTKMQKFSNLCKVFKLRFMKKYHRILTTMDLPEK